MDDANLGCRSPCAVVVQHLLVLNPDTRWLCEEAIVKFNTSFNARDTVYTFWPLDFFG